MTAAHGRAFTALVNPIAGHGHAVRHWTAIEHQLRAAGADVRTERTRSRQHAIELAAQVASAGRVAVAVGGDGLARDVAGGVVPASGSMAIVPAGRGNDLARKLVLPGHADALARLLLDGPMRTLDVIEAGGNGTPVIVIGNVYAGIDSVSNELINRGRWLPGLLAYRLAPVRAVLTWRPPTYALTADGRSRAVTAHTVVVANSGAYGHGLQIVPDARLDDGQLDVLVVGSGPRHAIALFMREAKTGRHVERPEVDLSTARRVTLAADRPLPVYGDGDELGTLPMTVRIRPAALNLIAP